MDQVPGRQRETKLYLGYIHVKLSVVKEYPIRMIVSPDQFITCFQPSAIVAS
jgi:hypothetical protein